MGEDMTKTNIEKAFDIVYGTNPHPAKNTNGSIDSEVADTICQKLVDLWGACVESGAVSDDEYFDWQEAAGLICCGNMQDWNCAIPDEAKCLCGEELLHEGLEVKGYDHANGYNVDGHDKRQWLYVTCRKCGYDMSFAKLGIRGRNDGEG
jgi:hypothetical protein